MSNVTEETDSISYQPANEFISTIKLRNEDVEETNAICYIFYQLFRY